VKQLQALLKKEADRTVSHSLLYISIA